MKYIKSEFYLLKYLIIKGKRWQVHFDMIPLNVTFYIVFILQNYTETLCVIQRFGLWVPFLSVEFIPWGSALCLGLKVRIVQTTDPLIKIEPSWSHSGKIQIHLESLSGSPPDL